MIDYSTISNTSGAFPNVVSLNVTAPGAGDGTPFIKAMIDDLWGARQACMNHAGQTPNATTESSSSSQFLTAVQKISGNPGEVIAWMGDASDPGSLDIRLLPLTGQGVLRTSYPDLDTYCYVGNSDNSSAPAFYRADDAAGTSRNIAGIYLILPDLRGYTIRGLDTAAAVDPDGATRSIGDVQDWAIKTHAHYVWGEGLHPLDDNNILGGTGCSGVLSQVVLWTSGAETTTEVMADSIPTTSPYTSKTVPSANQKSEVRMTNSAARWCIRY